MGAIKGQADLLYRKGVFYLAVTLDVPDPNPNTPNGTLGVDPGIVHLATDSTGESFSGKLVEKISQRHHACAGVCSTWHQKRKTASEKLSGKEPDFRKTPMMSSPNGLFKKPKPTIKNSD